MRNDKEGGWTILSNDAMRALTDEVLGGGNYCVVEPPVVNEIRAGSLRLAKRIVSFEEDPRWMKAVCKGWRSSSICASLKLLLKSHKGEGDVKCRAVHAAPVYSLEGLSRWMMQKIRGKLKNLPHLIHASKQVVQRIEALEAVRSCILVKVDIKDFYAVGAHHVIAGHVAALFAGDEQLRSTIFDAIFYLLDHQYVKESDNFYKINSGCGIGLLHASNVADACFYSCVERDLIAQGLFGKHGVYDWFRFRDDMCFVVKGGQNFKSLLAKMEEASFFEPKTEDCSTVELRYLNLRIRREGNRLITLPFLKDPGLSRRLSRLSAHPHEIHAAWPRMLLKKVAALTNVDVAKVECIKELTERFINDGCLVSHDRVKTRRSLGKGHDCVFWMPTGYHPWWALHVKRAIASLNKETNVTTLLQAVGWNNPCIRLA